MTAAQLRELRQAAREGRIGIDSQRNNHGDGLHLQWIWGCISIQALQHTLEHAQNMEPSTYQGELGWIVEGPEDSDPDVPFRCFVVRTHTGFTVTALAPK